MKSAKTQKRLSKWIVNGTLLLLVLLWTIPTMGIFVSSFRQRDDIATRVA
jgi:alpha-glucoside transport system permease protein